MDYVEGQNKTKHIFIYCQLMLYILPNINVSLYKCRAKRCDYIIDNNTAIFSLSRSKYFEIIILSLCFYCIFRIFRRSCQTPFEACGVTVFSDSLLHLICLNESKLEMSCTKIQKDLSIITSTS